MSKKGFTLIELLATLVILAVIMLVAVPSTMSILDKNRRETFISDAKRFVALAESEIRNNDQIDTTYGGFIVFKLSSLNDGSFDTDPDGNNYDQNNSFVAVHKQGTAEDYQFVYYVQMKGEESGIPLINSRNLERDAITKSFPQTTLEQAITSVTGVASPNITEY